VSSRKEKNAEASSFSRLSSTTGGELSAVDLLVSASKVRGEDILTKKRLKLK